MKCFTHSAADALGTCHVCSRAVCRDCAIEVENRLTCGRDFCKDQTGEMARQLGQTFKARRLQRFTGPVLGFMILGIGLVFIAEGAMSWIVSGRIVPDLTLLLGVFFAAYGSVTLYFRYRVDRSKS